MIERQTETIEWISVEDDLPDAELTVLLASGECIYPGYFDGMTWCYDTGGHADPTHWAEMPEGPKQ